MKLPKKINRNCPFCKKKTEHKLSLVSTGGKRSSLKRGSIQRAALRGRGVGMGNKGKWGSKPARGSWKRKTKSTKRLVVLYSCQSCKKSHPAKFGRRVGKIQFEEPQLKK